MSKDLEIYNREQLREVGVSRGTLDAMLREGQLLRIARGWYANPDADKDAVSAIRAGGRLGCLSACKLYGLWIPPGATEKVHVVRTRAMKKRKHQAARVHVVDSVPAGALCSVWESLRQVLCFHDVETSLIVLESALDKRLVTYSQALELIAQAPASKQARLHFLTPGAQSGSETRVRLFFQGRRVPVKIQQHVLDTGRVDLLVGKSWIVECDSASHHTGTGHYHDDRVRDLNSEVSGYHTTRLSYVQIWHQWEETKVMLSTLLKQRKHRVAPKCRPVKAAEPADRQSNRPATPHNRPSNRPSGRIT